MAIAGRLVDLGMHESTYLHAGTHQHRETFTKVYLALVDSYNNKMLETTGLYSFITTLCCFSFPFSGSSDVVYGSGLCDTNLNGI